MPSQKLAQICLPFLFVTQATIGRSGFCKPLGCRAVVLGFPLIHTRVGLLPAGLDGPLGACCQGGVYHLLDHGMARVGSTAAMASSISPSCRKISTCPCG